LEQACVFLDTLEDEILGLSTIPMAGDEFEVVDAMEEARIRAAKQAELLCTTCLATETGEGRLYPTIICQCF